MIADALATAVFVLGPEKGYALWQKLQGVDCLIVGKEGKMFFSPGLKERIFLILDFFPYTLVPAWILSLIDKNPYNLRRQHSPREFHFDHRSLTLPILKKEPLLNLLRKIYDCREWYDHPPHPYNIDN